jgi:hypothetical protein
MFEMTRPITHRLAHLASAAALAALVACGGGGSDPAPADNTGGGGNNIAAIACDLTHYQAGAVVQPTAAQLAAYVGTYKVQEGSFGPNPGDPFVKSADATMALAADGTVTYNGGTYTATSICMDKAAGPYGTLIYVEAGKGTIDMADKVDATLGQAWGSSPVDGVTMFQNGAKQ